MGPADEPTDDGGRDWNALLERVLAPFRTEAAAFRVLMVVVAIFGVLIAVVLLARAL
ncbi:MAG TPA: hypothetical protein VK501_05040 [Baekduia sp.]|uniref:hypothetical protein n=1 Tax=Baekduia sp. TaxID=2600305 RepID=UPI002BA6F5AB|nr:hypothetical protein [Baekduia sp.]HMJ33263.1 hypothetical protein [Baekduia sp.]